MSGFLLRSTLVADYWFLLPSIPLAFYFAIVGGAAPHLHSPGWLILEHGSNQALEVAQLLERHGFTQVSSHLDFSGKPRVTLGTVHSPHQETT